MPEKDHIVQVAERFGRTVKWKRERHEGYDEYDDPKYTTFTETIKAKIEDAEVGNVQKNEWVDSGKLTNDDLILTVPANHEVDDDDHFEIDGKEYGVNGMKTLHGRNGVSGYRILVTPSP